MKGGREGGIEGGKAKPAPAMHEGRAAPSAPYLNDDD